MLQLRLFKVLLAAGTDGMAVIQLSVLQHKAETETLPSAKVRLPATLHL